MTLWDVPTEDLWARDSGPIIAKDGAGNRVVQHIRFNGWGNRQGHANDGQIAARMAERLGLPLRPTGLVGEAGAVEQDGHGLLIAHDSSWVHDNRNPGMTRDQIGAALREAYGADRILWSAGLRDQDITDYHIDSLGRLTGPGRVLINLPKTLIRKMISTIRRWRPKPPCAAGGLSVEVIYEPERRRVDSRGFRRLLCQFLCLQWRRDRGRNW